MAHKFHLNLRESLLVTLDESQPEEASNEQAGLLKSPRLRASIYNFDRAFLNFLTAFHRIDSDKEFRLKPKRISLTDSLRRQIDPKKLIWPRALLVIYIVSSVVLWANVYYQYAFDVNKIKLHRIETKLHSSNDTLVRQQQAELGLRVNDARKALAWLGAPHLNWPFMTQTLVWIFCLSGLSIYIVLWVQYDLYDWRLLAPTMLMRPERERQARAELILGELHQFAGNSLAFARARLDQTTKELLDGFEGSRTEPTSGALLTLADQTLVLCSQRLIKNHLSVLRRLRESALDGRLNPLNRTPSCQDQLALACALIAWSFTIGVSFVVVLGYGTLNRAFQRKGLGVRLDNPADILHLLVLALNIGCHAVTSVYLAILMVVIWLDQWQSATGLRSLIARVVQVNELRLAQLAERTQSESVDELVNKIEQDTLLVVLHCRLFSRSFELSRGPISNFSLAAVLFGTIVLVSLRTHSPYFDADIRWIWLMFGISTAGCAYIYLLPLGTLNHRIIKAHAQLWQLAAQLARLYELSRESRHRSLKDANDNVIGFSLRSELTDTRQNMARFAYRVLALEITSRGLIRLFLGAFIVFLSLSTNLNVLGDGFSELINDPFGLYRN